MCMYHTGTFKSKGQSYHEKYHDFNANIGKAHIPIKYTEGSQSDDETVKVKQVGSLSSMMIIIVYQS